MRVKLTVFMCVIGLALAAQAAETKRPRRQGKTTITSSRMEYDYKEAKIYFEENVNVNDPEFKLRADRVIVIMEGTNDIKQVRCMGNVELRSEDRTARCAEAVYTKASGKIVMTGDATLQRANDSVWGRKITIWVDDERMECEPVNMVLSPGAVSGSKGLIP